MLDLVIKFLIFSSEDAFSFTDKLTADKLKHDNLIRHAKDRKHREKKRRICDYTEKVTHSISKKEEKLKERLGELSELRQKHINDLTLYIFEVSEVKQKRLVYVMIEFNRNIDLY